MDSLNAVEIIACKRDKGELSTDQIRWFIREYTAGNIPDYQASAWCMAVWFNGMTRRETVDLTLAMVESGERVNLGDAVPFAVDKHSSGGVGDKTTLVVLPVVVACGLPVAKMSGRGLGHTGGTLDKLESIRGFRVELSIEEFKQLARDQHLVLAGQTTDLALADKKLYALRDVTATVNSLPLIAGSIMSKKIAGGAQAVVLDVKTGAGAFMPTVEKARELARTMVDIGVDVGLKVVALISDMNQPLGRTAGHALEVREAIETLRGEGEAGFREHCLTVAAHMLSLSPQGGFATWHDAYAAAANTLRDGSALARFRQMVEAQGGDVTQVDDPSRLPQARFQHDILAPRAGFVSAVNALQVGMAVVALGGGRAKKSDPIDHAVGVETVVKVGDAVQGGHILFRIHANDESHIEGVQRSLAAAYKLSPEKTDPLPLFYDVIQGTPA